MKRVLETLTLAAEYLKKAQVSRARRVAEELLAHVLGCERMDLYLQFEQPLSKGELEQYRACIARAAKQEPYEYIIGEIPFYHLQLSVNRHVLIPRPETEILLDAVCSTIQEEEWDVWDLCTGSGCLGIGLKKARPMCRVTLSDISESALAVAQENARRNDVVVTTLLGDLLAPFALQRADVIVCNPPYVTSEEYEKLDKSVKLYEPKEALVGGECGLSFYRRLAQDLPHCLRPHGKVFLEMGAGQGKAVSEIFNSSFWKKGEVILDWAGKDRFFFLEAH